MYLLCKIMSVSVGNNRPDVVHNKSSIHLRMVIYFPINLHKKRIQIIFHLSIHLWANVYQCKQVSPLQLLHTFSLSSHLESLSELNTNCVFNAYISVTINTAGYEFFIRNIVQVIFKRHIENTFRNDCLPKNCIEVHRFLFLTIKKIHFFS